MCFACGQKNCKIDSNIIQLIEDDVHITICGGLWMKKVETWELLSVAQQLKKLKFYNKVSLSWQWVCNEFCF